MKRHYTLSGLLLCLMTLFTLSASAAPDKDYLCFTAKTAGSTVKLMKDGTPTAVNIEYSTDGTNWNDYAIGNSSTSTLITLTNAGDKVYFRNTQPAKEVAGFSTGTSGYYYFALPKSVAVSGNVMSLVDKTCQTTTIPCDYCFYQLFYNCKALTTAPELPATTLADHCYEDMFYSCSSLTAAPELPATTLANRCYYNMFYSCKKLKDIKVAFTDWSYDSLRATTNWTSNITTTDGTFSCPEGLQQTTGATYVPTSWTTIKNTYDLTFGEGKQWASLCVNLPLQVPEGVEVYYASAVEGSTIELTQIAASTVMAAKTAVIVKGAGTVSFPIVAAAGTSYPDNLFQGSSVDKACNAGENYVLNASMSSDTSVHFSIYTGTTLSNHKAWLPMSAVGGASSIQFRFADATAISSVETEVAEDVIYNLAGQRVGSDYRGLVIKNGKKTFNN